MHICVIVSQGMFLGLDTIQLIHASAFRGMALRFLMIHSNGLQKIPDLTLLRKSLKTFEIVCGTNCSLNVDSDHFSKTKKLRIIRMEKAGLTDILWLLSLRKQASVISVAYNKIATLAPIYGIRFEKLAFLNLNHNFIIGVNTLNLEMPELMNLKLEENKILHFDLPHCNFNGTAPKLNIYLFGNPLNCNARWQWLHNSIIVREDNVYGVVKCGERKTFIMRTGELTCWNSKSQVWEKLVRHEDYITATRPVNHKSMIYRLLIKYISISYFRRTNRPCNGAYVLCHTLINRVTICLSSTYSRLYANSSWQPVVQGMARYPIGHIEIGSREILCREIGLWSIHNILGV